MKQLIFAVMQRKKLDWQTSQKKLQLKKKRSDCTMNGKIVYDKPGRIRFRCGAYAFERELETAIQEALLRNRFVLQVEVHAQNGGILVHYRNGHRLDVIRLVARMNPRTMKPLENQIGTEQIDSDFKNDLAKLVAKRVLYLSLIHI